MKVGRIMALGLAATVATVVAVLVPVGARPGPPPAGVPPQVATPGPASEGPKALRVLHAWDQRRAAAWAAGDPAALGALYLPGSLAGRRDRSMLRAYRGRGLRVEQMATRVLELRELRRTRHRWVLLVTDQVVGAVAVGPGQRVPLPRGGAATRRLVLRAVDGVWLMARVRPVS